MPDTAISNKVNTGIDLADSFAEIVDRRRSVRGFLPEPVDQQILNRVFDLAQRAPSNCNTQPWQIYVASGAACDRLRQRFSADFLAGKMSMDFPYDGKYEGVYKDRQYGAAQTLYSAMGIAREDKTARGAAFMRNFELFGAPHAAFIFIHENFGIREAADTGMYAQNLMLSLSAHGLASCPQTALSFFADQVREELGVGPELKLLFGISFGYEDTKQAANTCRTERASLPDAVHFIS